MSPNAVSCQVMLAQAVREVEEKRSGFVAIIIIFITIFHIFCFNGIIDPKHVLFAVFVQHELNLGPLCCATSTWWLRRIATPFLRIYFFVNHLNIFLKIIFARRMLGVFDPICFPSCWNDGAMFFPFDLKPERWFYRQICDKHAQAFLWRKRLANCIVSSAKELNLESLTSLVRFALFLH